MTETTAAVAPVSTDTAPQATATAATDGSNAAPAANDALAALSEDTRKTVESKGWKGLDDAAKSYNELFTKFNDVSSKALTLPAEDAKPEDIDAFFQKLGMPEKPEGYQFDLPKDLPEGVPYDSEFANEFKAMARDARLPAKQAQALHDAYVKNFATKMQVAAEAKAKAVAEAETKAATELSQAWGQPGSDAFNQKLGFVARAIEHGGIKDELVALGVMDAQGTARYPKVAQLLASAGEALFTEHGAIVGGVSVAGNPYAKGSENVTQQMMLYRQDPARAQSLIAAAGRQPSDFGL